ncbi:hypothetical protein JRQ81_000635, partial [Phrynocephalus forsythii]
QAPRRRRRRRGWQESGGGSCCCCSCCLCRPGWRLPRGLALGPSLSSPRALGVWCVGQDLEPGLRRLPPGPRQEEEEEEAEAAAAASPAAFPPACWKETSACNKISSWWSLVRQSQCEDEANVAFEWISGELHIRVCYHIAVGTELLHWLTEPLTSPTCPEKNEPANGSDEAIQKKQVQELLAVAVMKSRSGELEVSVQQGVPEISKVVEQKTRAPCVPRLDQKVPTKQPVHLDEGDGKGGEPRRLLHMPREMKGQSEESQQFVSCAIDEDSEGNKEVVPVSQADLMTENATETKSGETSSQPRSSVISLRASLVEKALQRKVPSCVKEVPPACPMSTPWNRVRKQGRDAKQEDQPHSKMSQGREGGSERRYQCDKCGKAFLQLCHLKNIALYTLTTNPFCARSVARAIVRKRASKHISWAIEGSGLFPAHSATRRTAPNVTFKNTRCSTQASALLSAQNVGNPSLASPLSVYIAKHTRGKSQVLLP